MGRLHAEKFARLPGVELVGVADADRARAEEVATKVGCAALPDWRQAISRAQAAVVAVPTERHLEVAGACLDAGLHVLVEKPLAVNLEQADRVLTEEIDIANARIEFADGCVASLSASRVSQAPVRKLRVFQTDVYVSANLQAGKLRYVRQAAGAIEETEEVHAGGDALSVQAAAFVAAVARQKPVEVSGEHGRRALELALEVGRLVRERMQRSTA